mmetsp:Transcript_81155/g.225857  ORF Transcript_81155/g.225857 Transcript_81155/m.225857 type:complete len:343 (-) Transcript_81155:8-1036(-)
MASLPLRGQARVQVSNAVLRRLLPLLVELPGRVALSGQVSLGGLQVGFHCVHQIASIGPALLELAAKTRNVLQHDLAAGFHVPQLVGQLLVHLVVALGVCVAHADDLALRFLTCRVAVALVHPRNLVRLFLIGHALLRHFSDLIVLLPDLLKEPPVRVLRCAQRLDELRVRLRLVYHVGVQVLTTALRLLQGLPQDVVAFPLRRRNDRCCADYGAQAMCGRAVQRVRAHICVHVPHQVSRPLQEGTIIASKASGTHKKPLKALPREIHCSLQAVEHDLGVVTVVRLLRKAPLKLHHGVVSSVAHGDRRTGHQRHSLSPYGQWAAGARTLRVGTTISSQRGCE